MADTVQGIVWCESCGRGINLIAAEAIFRCVKCGRVVCGECAKPVTGGTSTDGFCKGCRPAPAATQEPKQEAKPATGQEPKQEAKLVICSYPELVNWVRGSGTKPPDDWFRGVGLLARDWDTGYHSRIKGYLGESDYTRCYGGVLWIKAPMKKGPYADGLIFACEDDFSVASPRSPWESNQGGLCWIGFRMYPKLPWVMRGGLDDSYFTTIGIELLHGDRVYFAAGYRPSTGPDKRLYLHKVVYADSSAGIAASCDLQTFQRARLAR